MTATDNELRDTIEDIRRQWAHDPEIAGLFATLGQLEQELTVKAAMLADEFGGES